MKVPTYIVATTRQWNIETFQSTIRHLPGAWHLFTDKCELTPERVAKLQPAYIFFPHWQHKVPTDILELAPCVCFHETDVPYGRVGSPIQNLIKRGHDHTVVSAIRMTEALDAGPVYLQTPLSLAGRAEEIYYRAANIVADMIAIIIAENPIPEAQSGEVTVFKRRTPDQSTINFSALNGREIYDHIRMLDAQDYPKAFIDVGNWRIEFSHAEFNNGVIDAKVCMSERKDSDDAKP